MADSHKIIKKLDIRKFLEIIEPYDLEEIETTPHTFFHFSREQRKIFKEDWIRDFIKNETPRLVGIQNNGCYAVFYDHKGKILRVILEIRPNSIIVVTIYFITEQQIPRI